MIIIDSTGGGKIGSLVGGLKGNIKAFSKGQQVVISFLDGKLIVADLPENFTTPDETSFTTQDEILDYIQENFSVSSEEGGISEDLLGIPDGVATLDSNGKIPAEQLPNSIMELKGEWDADTNTPTLLNGSGNAGDVWEVTVAGTHDFGTGSIEFNQGDWVVYGADGVYYKSPNTNPNVTWATVSGKPSTFTPAAHTLDSHSNVSITSNTDGELLKWNGTNWVNNTLAEAGIQFLKIGDGYGLKHRSDNPTFYSTTLGSNALDLGYSDEVGTYGATGNYASAVLGGRYNKATNIGSTTVGGMYNVASGELATTIGSQLVAPSSGEIALGINNVPYTPASTSIISPTDRILSVGIGSNTSDKKNAITLLKNGNLGFTTKTTPTYQLDMTGDINLPTTTNANKTGIIRKDGVPFITEYNPGTVNGVTVVGFNTLIGIDAGNLNMGSTATDASHASNNTAIGRNSLRYITTGSRNTAVGVDCLRGITTGIANTAIGNGGLNQLSTGNDNIGIGYFPVRNMQTGSRNIAIGSSAGNLYGTENSSLTSANRSIFIGSNTRAATSTSTNEIVIGAYAMGNGDNSATIGNTTVTKTYLRGTVYADTSTIANIDADTTGKALVTKEYLNAKLNFSAAAPATSSDAGVEGELRADASYLYVYKGGSWKRAALTTF